MELTLSGPLSELTSFCCVSKLLLSSAVVAYGLTSCCTSVINSPQSVYRRRAADASPSLTVHWSSNYTTKVKVSRNRRFCYMPLSPQRLHTTFFSVALSLKALKT